MDEFKLKEGTTITKDLEEVRVIKNKRIRFVPLWKYLLEGLTTKNI